MVVNHVAWQDSFLIFMTHVTRWFEKAVWKVNHHSKPLVVKTRDSVCLVIQLIYDIVSYIITLFVDKYILCTNYVAYSLCRETDANVIGSPFIVSTGLQTRSRQVLVHSDNGGRQCPEVNVQRKFCPFTDCYQWRVGPWTECSINSVKSVYYVHYLLI